MDTSRDPISVYHHLSENQVIEVSKANLTIAMTEAVRRLLLLISTDYLYG